MPSRRDRLVLLLIGTLFTQQSVLVCRTLDSVTRQTNGSNLLGALMGVMPCISLECCLHYTATSIW